MYLGYLGYKTANVPDREGHRAAAGAVRRSTRRRSSASRSTPSGCAEIRKQRARRLGGDQRAYAELLEIYEELEEAESLHRRLGCPVIEISDLSIEETAARVIRLVEQRRAENGTRAQAPLA